MFYQRLLWLENFLALKTKCKLLSNDRIKHFLEFVLLVNIAIFLYLCFTILCMFANTK